MARGLFDSVPRREAPVESSLTIVVMHILSISSHVGNPSGNLHREFMSSERLLLERFKAGPHLALEGPLRRAPREDDFPSPETEPRSQNGEDEKGKRNNRL